MEVETEKEQARDGNRKSTQKQQEEDAKMNSDMDSDDDKDIKVEGMDEELEEEEEDWQYEGEDEAIKEEAMVVVEQEDLVEVNITCPDNDHKEVKTEGEAGASSASGSVRGYGYKWQCTLCPRTGSGLSYLKNHLSQMHFKDELRKLWPGKNKDPCPYCLKRLFPAAEEKNYNYLSYSRATIAKHLGSVHDLVLQFVDDTLRAELEEKVVRFRQSQNHAAIVKQSDKVKCLLCSAAFSSLRSMKQHLCWNHFGQQILKQSSSTPDGCGICKYKPTNDRGKSRDIVKHLSRMHGYLYKVIPDNMVGKLMQLDKDGSEREVHRSRGTVPEGKMACPYCKKNVKEYASLMNHLVVFHLKNDILSKYGNADSNQCSICGKEWNLESKDLTQKRLASHLFLMHGYLDMTVTEDAKEELERYKKSLKEDKEFKKMKKVAEKIAAKTKEAEAKAAQNISVKQTDKAQSPKAVQETKTIIKATGRKCQAKNLDGSKDLDVGSGDSLKCPFCDTSYTNLRNFKIHLANVTFRQEMMTQTGSSALGCGICGHQPQNSTTISKARLERHVLSHLAIKHNYVEKLLPKNLQESMAAWKSLQVKESNFKDPECDDEEKAACTSFLLRNTSRASDWQCILCPQKANGIQRLRQHLSGKHFRNKLLAYWQGDDLDKPCPYCDVKLFAGKKVVSYFKPSAVASHLGMRHDLLEKVVGETVRKGLEEFYDLPKGAVGVVKKSVNCPLCETPVRVCSRSALESHLILSHYRKELRSLSNSSGSQCGICDQKFGDKRPMLKHVGIHHGLISTVVSEEVLDFMSRVDELLQASDDDEGDNDDDTATAADYPEIEANAEPVPEVFGEMVEKEDDLDFDEDFSDIIVKDQTI